MARDAAGWVVGLGAPMEDIFLDRKNITDIYVDAENAPIYLEHKEFGVLHTLFRYPQELLDRAFKNAVFSEIRPENRLKRCPISTCLPDSGSNCRPSVDTAVCGRNDVP